MSGARRIGAGRIGGALLAVVALAGIGSIGVPAIARGQSPAVPIVHFRPGSPELLEIAYPAESPGEPEEDERDWIREEAETLTEAWERQGFLYLQRLADFTGLDWPYRDIEVYLVRTWPTVSIEYPLVLALESVRGAGGEASLPEGEDIRFLLLAHQIAHYLLDDPVFVPADRREAAYDHPFMAPGNFDVEALVNWVTYRALEDLWGEERLERAIQDPFWQSLNPNHAYVVEALMERHRLSRTATLTDWLNDNSPGSEVFEIREEYAGRIAGDPTTPAGRERVTGSEYGLDLGATFDGRIFFAYVDEASPAARAGALQGDLLKTIEGRPVSGDVVEAQRQIDDAWGQGREVDLSVERSGEEIFLTIESP